MLVASTLWVMYAFSCSPGNHMSGWQYTDLTAEQCAEEIKYLPESAKKNAYCIPKELSPRPISTAWCHPEKVSK